MDTDGLSIKAYKGASGVAELCPEWQALMRNVGRQCFYHQPEWLGAFLSVYPEFEDTILVLGIRRNTRLVGVLPLQFRRRGGLARILEVSLPRTHQLYMPDCVVADGENASTVLEHCLEHLDEATGRSWDVFAARETLENSLIAEAFETLTQYGTASRPVRKCSLIRVVPYEDALAAMKPKARQNLMRRRKRIAESGDVRLTVETAPEQVSKSYAEFVELEASGWKGGNGAFRGRGGRPLAIKLNPRKRSFYQRVITELAKRGAVELHCLRVDGALVAARIWLVFGASCYALKTAYDERYGKYSPGMLTFDAAFRHQARKDGIRTINPLFHQPALQGWRPDVIWYRTYVAFNGTLKGSLVALAYRLAAGCRRRGEGGFVSRLSSPRTRQP